MSDLLRELCIRIYVRGRDPRGQTAAEYVGVLLVVSVIIAAVANTKVGDQIVDKIKDLVDDIAGGKSGKD